DAVLPRRGRPVESNSSRFRPAFESCCSRAEPKSAASMARGSPIETIVSQSFPPTFATPIHLQATFKGKRRLTCPQICSVTGRRVLGREGGNSARSGSENLWIPDARSSDEMGRAAALPPALVRSLFRDRAKRRADRDVKLSGSLECELRRGPRAAISSG